MQILDHKKTDQKKKDFFFWNVGAKRESLSLKKK